MFDAAQGLINWVLQQLLWETLLSVATAIGLTTAVTRGLGKLPDWKHMLWFGASIFVVSMTFFLALMWRPVSTPELRPQIIFAAYGGEIQNNPQVGAFVTLVVSIANIGSMQSIANSWIVDATVNGHIYYGQLIAVPDTVTLAFGNEVPNITYLHSSLEDRATNAPIAIGGQVVGLLAVCFPKLGKEFFKGNSPTFTIRFKDVRLNEYSASIKITGEHMRPMHVPGLSDMQTP